MKVQTKQQTSQPSGGKVSFYLRFNIFTVKGNVAASSL